MNKKLSTIESFWYYFSVIFSFGIWYTVKVVIKKAILDAENTKG